MKKMEWLRCQWHVADGGFVVGAALMNSKPIYVIRYQGFNWYNCPMIVNYACKSKEIWKVPRTNFCKRNWNEGGIGPAAGSSHHFISECQVLRL